MSSLDSNSISLENPDADQELEQVPLNPVKRSIYPNHTKIITSLVALTLIVLGVFAILQLAGENQDNRQQAKFCDDNPDSPYFDPNCLSTDTLTLSPTNNSNKNRPKTESGCASQGFWINDSCYLFWETLPGGTHVVVPPGMSGRSYTTLMPVDQALALQGSTPSPTTTSSSATSLTPTATPTVVYDFSIDGKCDSPFYVVGGKCVPNQRDPAWNSRWINASGCGAMQTLYYAMKKNPNLDVSAFLNEYYYEYLDANKAANTPTELNINILKDLGYRVERYKGVLAYHGEKLTSDDSTIFIGSLFGSDINHFASIDKISHNSDGTTTLNMIDSYFGADKCVSVRGELNIYNCYNNQGEKVTSLDLTNASIYVVSNNEI